MPAAPGRPALAQLADLLDRYDGLLLDAYGVLNDAGGALPGAAELVAELARREKPFLVVTNDASRLPGSIAARLDAFGLPVPESAILTSGQLLTGHFAGRGLRGARCIVLGTEDSCAYVRDAGGVVVPTAAEAELDCVVVGDDDGFPFLEGMNATLSAVCRAIDGGGDVHLCLPNPDLIFPTPTGFGFTSGAVALLLEAALARRYPDRRPEFVRLGKPYRPLYDEAIRRLGTRRLLMIGDQIETDIAGARASGLDSALVTTGVSRGWVPAADDALGPTYVIDRL